MMRRTKITAVLCAVFMAASTLSGCWDQKDFERTGTILQLGIEEEKDKSYLFSMTMPVITAEAQKENEVELITTRDNFLRESRESSRLYSHKELEGGKTQIIYFSEDIAAKGIHDFLVLFERNPELPLLANLAVVEGSPRALLEKSIEFTDKPRSAYYMSYLLLNARKFSYIPEARIHSFNIDYFAEGIDPVVPTLKLSENAVKVTGTAIFKDDKMVGRINTRQTMLMLAMKGDNISSEYIYKKAHQLDSEKNTEGMSLRIFDSKRSISYGKSEKAVKITLRLELDAYLSDIASHIMDEKQKEEELETSISETISNECNELIRYFQDIGSDPMGIGEIIRIHFNDIWNHNDKLAVYKGTDVMVEARLNILRYGAIY